MRPIPKQHYRRALLFSAGTLLAASPAAVLGQTATDDTLAAIREEMRASQATYEARIAELEKRLAAMEKPAAATGDTPVRQAEPSATAAATAAVPASAAVQPQVQAAAAPRASAAAPVAATAAAGEPAAVAATDPAHAAESAAEAPRSLEQRISALEQSQMQTDASLKEFSTPEYLESVLPKNFTFSGYMRAGYGINQYGGAQGKVTSPDPLSPEIGPGRFGNEPDTYGDLTLRYELPRTDDNDLRVALQTTFSFRYNGMKNNYTNQHNRNVDLLFREAFASVGNVFKSAPEIEFWAGQRWYMRQEVHMYDYFYLDTSGYGGGVENIKLGPGKFAAAWIGGTNDTVLVDNRYYLTKQLIDLRWYDLPSFADGKGMLWLSPQYVNGGGGGAEIPDRTLGLAVGWVQENELSKGKNTFSVQYGFGGAYGFGSTVPLADPTVGQPKDWLDRAQTVLLTNNLVWQFDERFSLNWAVIAQWDDMGYTWVDPVTGGDGPGSSRFFVTTGVRPLYMLTEHLGVESEMAVDWASRDRFSTEDRQTALGKFMLAGVIRPNGDVMKRPEIRLYGGYYYWGGTMPEGYARNGSKPDAVGTWVFGVQAELWW